MTTDQFPSSWQGRLFETAKILASVGIIAGFFGGAWSVTYGPAKTWVDYAISEWEASQERIMALDRRLNTVEQSVDQLSRDMLRQQGEDKVIRETPGLTYVSEPVYQGELITFNFQGQRTALGADCALVSTQAIFTDTLNAPTPGEVMPANINLSINPSLARPQYKVPRNIRPGRVTVFLVLQYLCGDQNVTDQTSTVAFELLEGERPEE